MSERSGPQRPGGPVLTIRVSLQRGDRRARQLFETRGLDEGDALLGAWRLLGDQISLHMRALAASAAAARQYRRTHGVERSGAVTRRRRGR